MLTFNVQLPIEELYCPSLACDAYDQVFIGFSQPLIGTFSLPIGDLKSEYENERKVDIEECDRIIDYLQEQMGKTPEQIKAAAAMKSEAGLSAKAKKALKKGVNKRLEDTQQRMAGEE